MCQDKCPLRWRPEASSGIFLCFSNFIYYSIIIQTSLNSRGVNHSWLPFVLHHCCLAIIASLLASDWPTCPYVYRHSLTSPDSLHIQSHVDEKYPCTGRHGLSVLAICCPNHPPLSAPRSAAAKIEPAALTQYTTGPSPSLCYLRRRFWVQPQLKAARCPEWCKQYIFPKMSTRCLCSLSLAKCTQWDLREQKAEFARETVRFFCFLTPRRVFLCVQCAARIGWKLIST